MIKNHPILGKCWSQQKRGNIGLVNRPPHELPLPLVISVPPLLVLGYHGDVGGSHGLGAVLHKLKARFLVRRVEVVEENASNSSRDLKIFDSD